MESNGYEHKLFEAIKAVATIAKSAYWEGWMRHCGSDMGNACPGCQHYAVCKATVDVESAIGTLTEWDC